MHNRNSSTFTRGNIGVCNALKIELEARGIGVFLYDIDQQGNVLQSFINVGSNASIDIVVITTSSHMPVLVDAARNYSNKLWLTFRTHTDMRHLLPRNLIYGHVPSFFMMYLKGILAATMSTSNKFAITVPNNTTAEWFNGPNFFLAGLKAVIPNPILVAYDGKGRFGFNEIPVLQHLASNYPTISILANQGSQNFYPAAIRSLNSTIKLIESSIEVHNPDSDKIAFSDPNVLAITEYNMLPFIIDIIDKVLALEPVERLIIRSKSEDETKLVRFGNFSTFVSKSIQKTLRNLEKQYLFKSDDDFTSILCNPDIVKVFKDITLVPNGECITYETALEGLVLHPDIIWVTLP